MVIVIKIIIWAILLYFIFKAVFIDLFVAFYDEAINHVVETLEKRGLKDWVKHEALCDLLKHVAIILILSQILRGTIECMKSKPENDKQTFKIELRNDN